MSCCYNEREQVWYHDHDTSRYLIAYSIHGDYCACVECGTKFDRNEGVAEPKELTREQLAQRQIYTEPPEPPMASGKPVPERLKRKPGRPPKQAQS